jgi:threonine synthase
MKAMFDETGYIMDPHGAVGYLGLQEFLKKHPEYYGTFLETAHPMKFLETVERVIGKKLEIPPAIDAILNKEKISISIKEYADLKAHLLE